MTAAQFQEALGALVSGAIHSGVTAERVLDLLDQVSAEVMLAAANDDMPARPANGHAH